MEPSPARGEWSPDHLADNVRIAVERGPDVGHVGNNVRAADRRGATLLAALSSRRAAWLLPQA